MKKLLHRTKPLKTYAKICITNFSKVQIPTEIEQILSLGLHAPIGGVARKNGLLSKFEGFFKIWLEYAHKIGLDPLQLNDVRSQLHMEFRKLSNCSTDTANVKTLRNFLEMHPDIIICPTDKTKNLAIFDLDDYILKLKNVFTPDKFVPLPRNPIKSDLTKFRALAFELEPYGTCGFSFYQSR